MVNTGTLFLREIDRENYKLSDIFVSLITRKIVYTRRLTKFGDEPANCMLCKSPIAFKYLIPSLVFIVFVMIRIKLIRIKSGKDRHNTDSCIFNIIRLI